MPELRVLIPNSLFHRIRKQLGKKYDSVDKFILGIVRQRLDELEDIDKATELTKQEEEKIKDRLRKLGYLT